MPETDDITVQHELAVRDEIIVDVRAIETDEDRQQANVLMAQADGWLKRFAEEEERVCKPQYQAWKNSKAWFAEKRKPVEDFMAGLKRVLVADRQKQIEAQAREQERQNKLAEKRFERAQASGKGTPAIAVAPIVQDTGKRVETEAGNITWVDNWLPQVIDETKIPRQYLMPDMTKLKAAAKAGIEVPGVRRVNEPFQKVTR